MTLMYEPNRDILKMHVYTTNKLSRSRLSKVRALQTDRQTDRQMRPNAQHIAFTGGNELMATHFLFYLLILYLLIIYSFTNLLIYLFIINSHTRYTIKSRNEQEKTNNKKGKGKHLEFLSVTTSIVLRCVQPFSFHTINYRSPLNSIVWCSL